MSYYKALLIFANIVSTDTTYTPPNPTPKAHEISKYGDDDSFGVQYSKIVPKIIRAAYLVVGLGEIGLMAAPHFPDHPVLQKLLSLVPNPSGVSSIRITTQYLIGTACLVSAALIRRSAYRALGGMFTFKLSIRDNHRLVTDGPYAYVRHPSYTGIVLHYIGTVLTCFATGTFVKTCGILDTTVGRRIIYGGVIALTLNCIMIVSRIDTEDKMMRKQFGAQWDEWARKVPCRFIPLII